MSDIDGAWEETLTTFNRYHQLAHELLTRRRAELVRLLSDALLRRGERPLAFELAENLSIEEKKQLFPVLVRLAIATHPHTGTARSLVLSLPHDWVIHRIKDIVDPILKRAGPDIVDEYRRALELYIELDETLLKELCEQGLKSDNAEIREAADDFR
jgi:hypothetical protein